MMALASTAKYAGLGEWPLLCKVVEIHPTNKTALVSWYQGTRTTKWVEGKIRVGSRYVPMLHENIPLDEIYHHSFTLTSTSRLRGKEQAACLQYQEDYL